GSKGIFHCSHSTTTHSSLITFNFPLLFLKKGSKMPSKMSTFQSCFLLCCEQRQKRRSFPSRCLRGREIGLFRQKRQETVCCCVKRACCCGGFSQLLLPHSKKHDRSSGSSSKKAS